MVLKPAHPWPGEHFLQLRDVDLPSCRGTTSLPRPQKAEINQSKTWREVLLGRRTVTKVLLGGERERVTFRSF